jgi:Cu/Ag efflux protein CusF
MTSATKWIAFTCLALGILLAGCGTPKSGESAKSPGPAKEYQMRGEVTALDAGGHVATIKHEEIKGFMSAMTMGYPVKDPAEFSKLSVGEPITATVYVKDDDMWVGNIQKAH